MNKQDAKKKTNVWSFGAVSVGEATGRERLCRQVEGCLGTEIQIKWPDGEITWCCGKGLDERPDGDLQIR